MKTHYLPRTTMVSLVFTWITFQGQGKQEPDAVCLWHLPYLSRVIHNHTYLFNWRNNLMKQPDFLVCLFPMMETRDEQEMCYKQQHDTLKSGPTAENSYRDQCLLFFPKNLKYYLRKHSTDIFWLTWFRIAHVSGLNINHLTINVTW